MIYSNKILAQLGRQVLETYPDLATAIINKRKIPVETDLKRLGQYFEIYCAFINEDPSNVRGPVRKAHMTEIQKVFISAMLTLYLDRYQLNKTISEVLMQRPPAVSRIMDEVKVRFDKDKSFAEKVTNILQQIKSKENDQRTSINVN